MDGLFSDSNGKIYSAQDVYHSLRDIGAGDCDSLFIHSDVMFGSPLPGFKRREYLSTLYQVVERLGVKQIIVPTFTYSFCNNEDYDVLNSKTSMGAFTGMFLGQEYTEGTIRNKLIAGCGKAQVYLSGFFTAAGAALIFYVSAVAATASIGSLLFSTAKPLSAFLTFGLLGALCCLSYVAIFCLIAMLRRSRSVSVALCMLLAVVLLLMSMYINLQLTQEEYINQLNITTQSDDVSVSITGENTETEVTMVPNPHYLTGIRRQIALFLQDLNPTGQAVQICAMNCANPVRVVLCNVLTILLACLTGIILFRRKDLK